MKPGNVSKVARYLESIGDMVPREPKPDGSSNGWELGGSLAESDYAPMAGEPWPTMAAAA
jgi:hypothetical protein